MRQSERQRVGIENVRERIERLCAGTLEVKGDGDGTVATITIPEETDL
jgi:signal transduction histidine kinase